MLVLGRLCDSHEAQIPLGPSMLLFPALEKKACFQAKAGLCTREATFAVSCKPRKVLAYQQAQGSLGHPRGCITQARGGA